MSQDGSVCGQRLESTEHDVEASRWMNIFLVISVSTMAVFKVNYQQSVHDKTENITSLNFQHIPIPGVWPLNTALNRGVLRKRGASPTFHFITFSNV